MKTNPTDFSSQARWIWHPDGGGINQYVDIVNEFELSSVPEAATLRIAADSNYQLWVNGIAIPDRPLVFVITGESNSGGIGLNADASLEERKPRSSVQILNPADGLFAFEPLCLGRNNLREHHRLESYYDTCHGLENGLASAVESGVFDGYTQVYLVKTGQGGSRIDEWAPDHSSGYWKKHVQRIEAAIQQIPGEPQWVVWFNLGINDAIAGTDINLWQSDVVSHLRRMKDLLPGAIIMMTQFQSMNKYPAFDAAIADIAAREDGVFAVDSTDSALCDENHWNYAGLKTMAQRMAEATNCALGEKLYERG
ncbi:MAG: sialate O-acetylesterase [bacterium]